jgi:hypothetical protein
MWIVLWILPRSGLLCQIYDEVFLGFSLDGFFAELFGELSSQGNSPKAVQYGLY